ncbi:MAG: polysaccharide biosynthesis protein, partial [Candidatus Nealsonbacteria bacterium]|nr:polysaccharide biosynthesis protein [Candidatus Nealsonbacteria bacterium]
FEGEIPPQYLLNIWGMIGIAVLFSLPIFSFFRLYSFSWAYVSTQELISLIKGTFVAFSLITVAFFLLRDQSVFHGFPRSTLLISYIFIFIFAGASRFAKRLYLQIFSSRSSERERTLIVGAGLAGEQILRSIQASRESNYNPIGFVDDDGQKQGILIHGIKVLGRIGDIPRVVKEEDAEGLIIALSSAGSRVIRQAVELGRQAKLKKIKIIPSLGEIINGQISTGLLREVEMEDLLGRDPVSLDKTGLTDFLEGKKVLITGAAGSIGSELSRQVAKFEPLSLLLLDQDETGIFNISEELKDRFPKLDVQSRVCDILDEKKIGKIFSEFSPGVVFHAAAYKHVPLMEENSDEAAKNNILGTETLVRASLANGTEKFIFISTDKAVNPSSVMGATKRAGEMICQFYNKPENVTKFISVRFGNVLNSRGSVIPIFREQIKRGGPVEITHPEMKRYFMVTSEACLLVMQAGAMGQGGEVFVLDMGEAVKIVDLAKEMIRLSGLEPDKDIPIVFTGIRPGEKLAEEIFNRKEEMLSTSNQKIFIAKLLPFPEEFFRKELEVLKEVVYKGNKETVIGALKSLIPEFKH